MLMPSQDKKVVMIIQSRVGSTRLPGKSLMDLAGQPLILRILERLSRVRSCDEIVLAIPDTADNDVLEALGKKSNVTIFRGSENNLMERYRGAAEASNASIIVRFPGDNAVPEPSEMDRIINFPLTQSSRGFSSNICEIWGSGYPDGIGAEVFEKTLLDEALMLKPTSEMREHIHLNFFDYRTGEARDSNWCPVRTVTCPSAFNRPDIVLDINTKEQYDYILDLYQSLYPLNQNFTILDVIGWHDKFSICE